MRIIQQQFDDVIDFTESFVNENKNNFRVLLEFVDEFDKIHTIEEKKLPYHINLIDELRANENAHSRILEKLLQQQEPTNKGYEILKSFLLFIIEKYRDKDEFHKIKIEKPNITQEKKRIDLWIRDNKNYTIIIENKMGWAIDQPKQLERYIETTKEQGFNEQQIYVLYLPPTYDKKPDEQTWGKYWNHDIRKKRYLNLSFKNDILPWLKGFLPNISPNNKFLSSAIEQYIDHLEGKFSLRAINNKMNMELQKFIREKLEINNIEPEKAFEIVSEKIQEIDNVLIQLESLQEKIQDEIDEKIFSMCYTELKALNFNVVRRIDSFPNYYPKSVGVKLTNKLTVWIGKDEGLEGKFFCQVNSNDNNKTLARKTKQIFRDIFENENVEEDKDNLLIWSYLKDKDKALTYLKDYCLRTSAI